MTNSIDSPGSSIDALTAGEALAAAMDESPICFGLVDRKLRLLFANRELGRLLGHPGEGQCIADLESIDAAIVEALRLAVGGDSVRDLEVSHDGRHHLVNCFPASSRSGEPVGASLLVRDITPWVADRERVERLQQIAGRLAAAATPEEVTAITADAGVDALGAAASAVALCDRHGGALRIVSGRGFSAETLERWSTIDRDRDAPLAQCVSDRMPVFVDSAGAAARYPDLAQPAPGHLAWAAVPLVSHQRVLGGLALSFDDAAMLAPPKRGAILALAAQCAQALERALLMSDVSRTNQRLEAALEAGTMGWWEWVPQQDRVVWSASLERIYGLEPGSFGGRYEDYLALVHPDDREAVAARIAEGQSGAGHEFEHRVLTPSGAVRWVDGRGLVIASPDGSAPRMGGISIGHRAQTERDRSAVPGGRQRPAVPVIGLSADAAAPGRAGRADAGRLVQRHHQRPWRPAQRGGGALRSREGGAGAGAAARLSARSGQPQRRTGRDSRRPRASTCPTSPTTCWWLWHRTRRSSASCATWACAR